MPSIVLFNDKMDEWRSLDFPVDDFFSDVLDDDISEKQSKDGKKSQNENNFLPVATTRETFGEKSGITCRISSFFAKQKCDENMDVDLDLDLEVSSWQSEIGRRDFFFNERQMENQNTRNNDEREKDLFHKENISTNEHLLSTPPQTSPICPTIAKQESNSFLCGKKNDETSFNSDDNPQNLTEEILLLSRRNYCQTKTNVYSKRKIESTDDGRTTKICAVENRSERKRKFPGPAGLLPELTADQRTKFSSLAKMSKETKKSPQKSEIDSMEIPCSQLDDNLSKHEVWLRAQYDLGLNDPNSPLKEFDIAWAIRRANLKQLPSCKIPFLLVFVKRLDVQGEYASADLKDKTGEMYGTIHPQLLEEYFSEFRVGAVLVLNQVSIFTSNQGRHYLNVTPSSVLSIYSTQDDGSVKELCLCKDYVKDKIIQTLHLSGSDKGLIYPQESKLSLPQKQNELKITKDKPCTPIEKNEIKTSSTTVRDQDVWLDFDDDDDEFFSCINESEILKSVLDKKS